ncbi:MAG: hypothetical protein ABFS37_05970 [Acidobacteriota bacterium]
MNQKILVLTLFLGFFAGGAAAADLLVPDGDGPVPVTVLVYMLDVDEIDSSQQTFTANVFLKYDWTDPRLAHAGTGPVIKAMDEIWHPHLQILNQQKLWKTFDEHFEVFPDGHVSYRQRVWGDFSQPMDLRDYPADHQVLTIQLVASGYSPDQVKLGASTEAKHAVSAELSVADFDINGSEVVVESYSPLDSGPGVASIRSSYFASRKTGYFVVKVIIPLILIVMMSWSVFWIDPAEGGTQIGVATTTMLTLIAFRFAIDSSLPKISYLTRLDTFVMASTVLVFLSLFEVVITSRLAKTGRQERAMLLDRWSRLIFPGAFVAVLFLALT